MEELMQRDEDALVQQTGSGEARRPPERAEVNEGIQTLK